MITLRADKRALLSAVEPCAKAASSNSPIATLRSVKVTGSADGIRIVGSDGQFEVERICPSLLAEDVSFCVNAGLFLSSVSALPDGDVSIEVSENKIVVKCGKTKFTHPTIEADDYPHMEPSGTPSVLTVTGGQFRKILPCTTATESSAKLPSAKECVCISKEGDRLSAAATNTHQLISVVFDGEATFECNSQYILLHPAFIRAVDSVGVGDAEEIEIRVYENAIVFDHHSGSVRKAVGAYPMFPNWRSVIPKKFTRSWVFDGDDMAAAINGLAKIADDNAYRVRFTQNGDTVTVSAHSGQFGDGSCEVTLAGYEGDGLDTVMSYKYVSNMLKAAGQGVRMVAIENNRPMQFLSESNDDWYGIVMPMGL